MKRLIFAEKERVLSWIQGENDLKYDLKLKNIKIMCKNIHAAQVSEPMPTPEGWHRSCHHMHGRAQC